MAQKESTFRPFVVAFGGEDYFLDRDIEKARLGKRLVLKLDAKDGLTDAQLVEHCESYSDSLRTIIVDNAQKVKGSKHLQAFIDARDVTDTSLVLVAIIRSEKLPEVWSSAISKGKSYERQKPKPWEDDAYLKFIATEATRFRVAVNAEVALMLFRFVGPDYYRLSNEIQKLASYVGQAATVTKDHVSKLTTRTPFATNKQVAEAVVAKDWQRGLNLLSILYMNFGG